MTDSESSGWAVARARVADDFGVLLGNVGVAGAIQYGFKLGDLQGWDMAWHQDNHPEVTSHAWSPNVDGVEAYTSGGCRCEEEDEMERRAGPDDIDW